MMNIMNADFSSLRRTALIGSVVVGAGIGALVRGKRGALAGAVIGPVALMAWLKAREVMRPAPRQLPVNPAALQQVQQLTAPVSMVAPPKPTFKWSA